MRILSLSLSRPVWRQPNLTYRPAAAAAAAAAGVGGRGELLPDGAPVLLGQEEPDVGASLQLGLGAKLIQISWQIIIQECLNVNMLHQCKLSQSQKEITV